MCSTLRCFFFYKSISPSPSLIICCKMAFPCVDSQYTMFRHPFTALTVGATMCGKSYFLIQLIKAKDQMIYPPVDRIVYSYKKYQPLFDTVSGVEFVQGLPKLDKSVKTLVLIDDQLGENLKEVVELFTVGAHHDNCSVIYVTQNMFYENKDYRTICRNAQYLIIFKSPRCMNQLSTLACQIYPKGKSELMIKAFEDATSKPYRNLVVDLKPDTPEVLRLRTNVLPDQGEQLGPAHLTHAYII